jgi:hypothetical protein
MDETYIKVKGQWKYLYRAVDREGQTIDFLLTAKRDLAAARRFFERAIGQHDLPDSITIDKSGANTAAILSIIADTGADIQMRQNKYLNNIVEQDHRAIKRITRPMMGFKNFHCAQAIIAGIETMHMIQKRQMIPASKGQPLSKAEQFYSLAFNFRTLATFFVRSTLLRHNPTSAGLGRSVWWRGICHPFAGGRPPCCKVVARRWPA